MFKINDILTIVDGKLINGNKDKEVSHYSVNHEFNMKGGFYFPIIFHGENREKYIIDSVNYGAMGFMIDSSSQNKESIINEAKALNPSLCILEVDSVNEAIYKLAKLNRQKYEDIPIIGITGSVGKTTMSSLLSGILKKEKKVFHDFYNRNMNTKLLISNDLLHLEDYEMAVIEMGTSQPGNMHMLSELVKPSIGVITTIGTAHLNKFETRENIYTEKLHITDFLKDEKLLFVNGDNDLLGTLEEVNNSSLRKCSILEAENVIEDEVGLSFDIDIYGKKTSFNLNLHGLHYLTNIVIAIRIAEHYKIKYENIIAGINEFKPISGRCKILKNTSKNITLIDDAYSSSFESVKCGLDVANKMPSNRKIAVLGKMAAYGEDAVRYHEDLGKYFKNLDFDFIYLTGEYTKHIFKGALSALEEKKIKRFKTQEQLLSELKESITAGDLIYIKAARVLHFDKIVKELSIFYDLK